MTEGYGKGKRRTSLKVTAPVLESKLAEWVEKAEEKGLCLNLREGRAALQELTDLYEPKDTYNMDETGLNYNATASRSISLARTRGVKEDTTRIMLVLTTNADGTDTLPALFIGRAVKPRYFGKKTGEENGFLYRKPNKAWMNSGVYQR
uniref:DDE-1 domain-containing protein n=1 Tax=Phytophthora ramorum TaxID=164328 RepID=H3H6R8_PHYRM